jgi:ABC-type branched-subunit amino acid transport system substrate-binding protein
VRHRHALGFSVLAATVLVTTACGSRGDDDEASDTTAAAPVTAARAPGTTGAEAPDTTGGEAPATSAAATTSPPTTAPSGATFGTMASPCGPGEATIAEGQNGDDGVLRLATANDHDNQFSPGLTQEMLDSAQAFAEWCNEQGGIQGLQIEVIDMDGHITEAAQAMELACDEAFAMVGGGLVLDDQTFPRFHECGMIDFAGYTVTTAKAVSNGMVQPIPNPPNTKPSQWLQWGAETYPEAVKNTALIYQNLATTQIVKDQNKATMEELGWTVTAEIPYELGEANWAPFAQQMKDENITAMSFTGSPEEIVGLLNAMDEVGYRPELILQEVNFYDQNLLRSAGASAEGIFVRTSYAPFEEPDTFPAIASYLEMMETHKPDGKIGGLGIQATSSYLMFATAANECLAANGGVLERECVLAAGEEITSWDGAGLHAETNPAENLPPECGIILEVVDGQWTREYPELGSPDDNADGFNCRENGRTEIEGNFGDYELGIDPNRD